MSAMTRDYEGPTFGISLTLLCERSGVEVPLVLGDILRWLAAHALAQPDVFAEAPKSVVTSQLKNAIDKGASLAELVEGTHPAVVGSLLKRWLEELPDPLLNWDQQVELLSACKDEGCIEARIASLNVAVALVDPIALGTLKPLLLFLQQYCFRQRRFDQQLLQVAVAFAPILFPAALAAGSVELRLAEETVATLVSNALHVFNPSLAANVPVVTPQALCEAAAEIMESQEEQQQQEHDEEQASSGGAGYALPSIPIEHVDEAAGEAQYEPYLNDGPFLVSLDEMVDSCVATALFSVDGSHEYETAGWGVDDDCGSIASSCSNVRLSGGGAASSGGASSCSNASFPLNSQCDMCHQPQSLNQHQQSQQPHHHQHPHHHHNSTSVKTPHHTVTCRRSSGQEGSEKIDAPYSPRAVLVTPLGGDQVRIPAPLGAADKDKPSGAAAGAEKAAAAPVSPAALAELAQREVAEGSVFCIISAQSGGVALTVTAPSAAVGASPCPSSSGKQGMYIVQQRSQLTDAADLQAAFPGVQQQQQADLPSVSRFASVRRPTEGGAIGEACAASREQGGHPTQGHGYLQGQEQFGTLRSSLSRQPVAGPSSDARQRRMTMGGGEDPALAVSSQQPRPQHLQQPQPHISAVGALYQHLPQIRARATVGGSNSSGSGGGSSGSGGGASSSGGGASSSNSSGGGGGASPQATDRLPPTAAASPASQGLSCVAELGVAGHLRVTLTSGLTLLVRELTTPEAMAHRVPIRNMSAAAMQGEKERLKRQLKDVAAAYEAFSGRALTQALKEPLRPVYVRYHKIKALMSRGRGSSASQGGGPATGRATQLPSPSSSFVSPARPPVVA